MQTFFGDDDYRAYIALPAEWCTKCRVEIWAYCLSATDDELVTVTPLLEMTRDWRLFLTGGADEEQIKEFRKHERTGRPLGSEGFIERWETTLDRTLKRAKPGPKGKKN